MEKLRSVKVNLPGGETRQLTFKYVGVDQEKLNCERLCPLGDKICSKLRNPYKPDDQFESMIDWCWQLSENDESLKEYVPVEGTVEENLGDIPGFDAIRELTKKNPRIKVTEFIDAACKGNCPMYSEDYGQCTSTNYLCLLQGVLKNSNFDPSLLEKKKEENVGEQEG